METECRDDIRSFVFVFALLAFIRQADGGLSTFNYTDGVMTSGHTSVDDMDFTIGGSPLEVRMTDGEGYAERYYNITTNSSGAMTSCNCEYRDTQDDFSGTETLTMRYDSGNRLLELTATEEETDEGIVYSYRTTFAFTWNGNDITRIVVTDFESEGDYIEDEFVQELTYEYGSNPETNNGIVYAGFVIDLDFMQYAGLFGRTTAHIPVSMAETTTHNSTPREYTVSVDKDGQGRITALYENGSLVETYYYSDTLGQLDAAPALSKATRAQGLRGLHKRLLRHRR